MVVRLTERCRDFDKGGEAAKREGVQGLPTGLHSSLKYCTKKNGLGKSVAEVRGMAVPIDELVYRSCSLRGWRLSSFLQPQVCILTHWDT